MVIISDIQLPKDSNGILKVSDVSTSAASDLSARTDITNPATSTFVKMDSDGNLSCLLGNVEGGGSLNSTEYPVIQVGGFDGEQFKSLSLGRSGRLETFSKNQNGSAQVLLGSAGATAVLGDSTITPIADPEGRDGWNFTNSVAGTKFNLYYYNGAQETLTLGDISSVFAKLYINNFASLSSAPFFHIYTKPTGSGDHGAFYHSRIDYTIDSSVLVGIGEQIILYGENKPNTPCDNRLVQLKTKTVNGDGASTEEVLYITLSTNSGATVNEKNITVSTMGFNTIDLGVDKGVVNREFKLFTGGSGGATEATLSALNAKISKGSDATLTDAQQVVIYGKNGTGSLKPIHITNNGDVEVEIADFVKGQATSSNSFPVVLASDQTRLNTTSRHQNTNTQVLSGASPTIGNFAQSSAIEAINGSNMSPVTVYIYTGAGTIETNFTFSVHKSYDGVHYFLDTGFSFMPLGQDVNGVIQPAIMATGSFDAQYIRVKVDNVSEATTPSINAYILERQ